MTWGSFDLDTHAHARVHSLPHPHTFTRGCTRDSMMARLSLSRHTRLTLSRTQGFIRHEMIGGGAYGEVYIGDVQEHAMLPRYPVAAKTTRLEENSDVSLLFISSLSLSSSILVVAFKCGGAAVTLVDVRTLLLRLHACTLASISPSLCSLFFVRKV